MNEPIGRFGSCRPARARRTAVETACTASCWPDDPAHDFLLHLEEFLALAFKHLVDRTPVQRDTDLGDVARSHRFVDQHAVAWLSASASFFFELGDRAIGYAAASRSRPCAAPERAHCARRQALLELRAGPSLSFSAFQRAVQRVRLLPSSKKKLADAESQGNSVLVDESGDCEPRRPGRVALDGCPGRQDA